MKIFGREPAVILGLVGAVLTWLAGLNIPGLNAGQAAAIVTALTALVMAWATRPVAPALFVAVLAPLSALFAQYNLHWSEASVTGLGAVILAVCAFFGVRSQVTPAVDPAPTALPSDAGQVR